jgi:hypothetical protein
MVEEWQLIEATLNGKVTAKEWHDNECEKNVMKNDKISNVIILLEFKKNEWQLGLTYCSKYEYCIAPGVMAHWCVSF